MHKCFGITNQDHAVQLTSLLGSFQIETLFCEIRLFQLPRFVPQAAGFRRAPVQTTDLKKNIRSYPEGCWVGAGAGCAAGRGLSDTMH